MHFRSPADSSTPHGERHSEPGHPLVANLVRLRSPGDVILVAGLGSGRNVPALLAAGLLVRGTEPDDERREAIRERFPEAIARGDLRLERAVGDVEKPFAAALSTHAFQHGTLAELQRTIATVTQGLTPAGDLAATFGSTSDPRCGVGERVDEATWRPIAGPECGATHVYLTRDGIERLLTGYDITNIDERSAAGTAGRWAHDAESAEALVHWFVEARKRT